MPRERSQSQRATQCGIPCVCNEEADVGRPQVGGWRPLGGVGKCPLVATGCFHCVPVLSAQYHKADVETLARRGAWLDTVSLQLCEHWNWTVLTVALETAEWYTLNGWTSRT